MQDLLLTDKNQDRIWSLCTSICASIISATDGLYRILCTLSLLKIRVLWFRLKWVIPPYFHLTHSWLVLELHEWKWHTSQSLMISTSSSPLVCIQAHLYIRIWQWSWDVLEISSDNELAFMINFYIPIFRKKKKKS